MIPDALLKEIKNRLSSAYGDRLKGIVLHGSEVRGSAAADSDIDVLVLLKGPLHQWQEIHTCTEALYSLILETGRVIDAMPVDVQDYESARAPLYQHAHREGILL